MAIQLQPLTKMTFADFGDVISTKGVAAELINAGQTQKFPDLARVDLGHDGRVQISIYRSNPIELPFVITTMERHPLGSQAFYPLHTRPFPVVVARTGCTPGRETIQAFLTNGHQGVNIRAGVWHHYQLSLSEVSDYLVIDRSGAGENCETCFIKRVSLNKSQI